MQNLEHDSAVLVESSPEYLWVDGRPNYDVNNIPNSNDLDEVTEDECTKALVEYYLREIVSVWLDSESTNSQLTHYRRIVLNRGSVGTGNRGF